MFEEIPEQDTIASLLSNGGVPSVDTFAKYGEMAKDSVITYLPKIFFAILIYMIGMWVVKKLLSLLDGMISKSGLSTELSGFTMSIASLAMKFVVILAAAGVLGFQVSSLIGILAGVVFAVGLALQGFLGNFAAGITIVFFKPYRVGDWVMVSEMFGKVKSIEIFNTILTTPSDKTLIIPNGQITDNIITNYSTVGKMRLELQVTMPYEEDFPRVKGIIEDSLKKVPLIIQEPEPLVGIESYDSHNIVVSVRPYIIPDDYWEVRFSALSAIKRAFSENNIKVAYSEGVELGPIGA
jgi:small conductance mechanosensitive channel